MDCHDQTGPFQAFKGASKERSYRYTENEQISVTTLKTANACNPRHRLLNQSRTTKVVNHIDLLEQLQSFPRQTEEVVYKCECDDRNRESLNRD